MTATDELRRMLDERGVEYFKHEDGEPLRKMAAAMSERGGAIGLDYGMGRELVDAARMMREAADTIESLSDKLQGVMGTRYCELFGTPERVADYFATQCMGGDAYTCEICPFADCDGGLHASPHLIIRAALLEWLRGDSNG